jgi:formylmethanofuran dehydrogenase subunit A
VGHRREVLKRVPVRVLERCRLRDLDREYTLSEIAIVTRAGPARILGLKHKGHLGVGADGDVCIYSPSADRRAMFELPAYVVKAGRVVVEKGEIRDPVYGPTLHVAPEFDEGLLPDVRRWFESCYSVQFANYPVDDRYLGHGGVRVACATE